MVSSDIFLQPPIRWFGYGFAIGEAFRYISTYEVVDTFYAIGALFIAFHVLVNAIQGNSLAAGFLSAYDTLVFDLLASATIPAIVVANVSRIAHNVISETDVPLPIRQYGPTIIGLLCLHLISEPLDNGIHRLMDSSIRQFY